MKKLKLVSFLVLNEIEKDSKPALCTGTKLMA